MTAELVMSQPAIDRDRDRWLKERQAGLTATDAGMMLGVAPRSQGGPWVLYHKKLAGLETGDTSAMERGRVLEPLVAQRFADRRPDLHLEPGGLYRSAEVPWMMATLDRLGYDTATEGGVTVTTTRRPVQLKTAAVITEEWGEDGSAIMPTHYRAQALWEMALDESDEVLVPCQFIDPWELRVYRLVRDAKTVADIRLLIDYGARFMHRLEHHDPPPVDDSSAATEILHQLFPDVDERSVQVPVKLSRRYRAALASVARAKRRADLARNQLLERAGDASRIVTRDPERGKPMDGYLVKVATRTASDRAAYTVEASDGPVVRLNPCGWARGGRS